jgi:lysozyme
MKVSPEGRDLIASFEQGPGGGPALQAYLCPAGVWTIGYGHIANVKPADTLPSRAAADILLDEDLVHWSREVARMLAGAPTSQHEFDALVSLGFNIGLEGLRGSTALRRHRAGDKAGAAAAIRWWNKARVNGQLREMPGLTRRRAAEVTLYLSVEAAARPMLAFAEMPEDEGMPQAVEPPRTMWKSKSLWAAGAGGVSGLGAIADQVSSVSQVAGSAASAGYSASALMKMFGPAIILGVIAVGCIAYFGWRYLNKVRHGEVEVR